MMVLSFLCCFVIIVVVVVIIVVIITVIIVIVVVCCYCSLYLLLGSYFIYFRLVVLGMFLFVLVWLVFHIVFAYLNSFFYHNKNKMCLFYLYVLFCFVR